MGIIAVNSLIVRDFLKPVYRFGNALSNNVKAF